MVLRHLASKFNQGNMLENKISTQHLSNILRLYHSDNTYLFFTCHKLTVEFMKAVNKLEDFITAPQPMFKLAKKAIVKCLPDLSDKTLGSLLIPPVFKDSFRFITDSISIFIEVKC